MWLTRLAVKRPLVAVMAFLAIALVGVLAYTKLPVELYPKVNLPYVSVTTAYPGASPQDVETFVTKPIEDAVAGVSGLKNITSTSAEGMSYVVLEFSISTDADTAASDTQRALASVQASLPSDAKAPNIVKYNFAGPIMYVTLSGSLPEAQLYTLADQTIRPALQTVPGVSQINLVGGQQREVQVRFDPTKLAAYYLAPDEIAAALSAENVDIPGGVIDAAGKEYNARLIGLYQQPADLLNLIVASHPGGTVRLRDVASVVDTTARATLLYRANGHNAIGFVVSKTSDANSVATAAGIKTLVQQLQPGLPDGAQLAVSYDGSVFIRDSLNGVQENLLEAVLLTGLVLLLFLHTWRSTIIVLLAIPTSLVATCIVMMVAGFSLNQLTLLALALSIGVLVDDSIVVLENIFRHLGMGKGPWAAAIDGRNEIGVAALAITFVDVVVYTPLGFLTGIVGQFFREFGFSVVAAVLFSLLVSFTLTPMLASRWLQARAKLPRLNPLQRFGEWWDGGFARVEGFYRRLLSWSLDHRKTVLAVSALSVVLALAYFPLHLLGTEFIPTSDEGVFTIEAHMPPGTNLAATDQAARQLELGLRSIPEVQQVLTSVGTGNETGFQAQDSPRLMELTVLLKDRSQRQRSVDQVLPQVNALLASIPGLSGRTQLPSASGSAQPVVVTLSGPDPALVGSYGSQIEALVKRTPGTQAVTDSNVSGAPELDAVANHGAMADLGVTSAQVAGVMRYALTGEVVTQLRPAGQPRVDVRLISAAGSHTRPADLAALPIVTSRGGLVRLGQVASVQQVSAAPELQRRNRQRTVSIGASLDGSRPLGSVSGDVQAGIAAMHLPPRYVVAYGGDTSLESDSFSSFTTAFALGLTLMYMLMVALFESLIYPLAVMFSVPVSLFGAFTALVLLRENVGLFSLIGLIMLFGLVAKNAILVIDFTERMRREGVSRREALLRAGPIRLRPILMTSATMVVSMLPLALKLTVGAESRASIGAVVAGGMFSSTLLSLLLVPVVYSTLDDIKQFFSRHRGEGRGVPQPEDAASASDSARLEPALAGSGASID